MLFGCVFLWRSCCLWEGSKLDHLKSSPFNSTACDSSAELFNHAEKPDLLSLSRILQKNHNGSSDDLMQLQLPDELYFYTHQCLSALCVINLRLSMTKLSIWIQAVEPDYDILRYASHEWLPSIWTMWELMQLQTHDSGSNCCHLLSSHSLSFSLCLPASG